MRGKSARISIEREMKEEREMYQGHRRESGKKRLCRLHVTDIMKDGEGRPPNLFGGP